MHFFVGHTAQTDRHEKRGHLIVRHGPGHESLDDGTPVLAAKSSTVAFQFDQTADKHFQLRGVDKINGYVREGGIWRDARARSNFILQTTMRKLTIILSTIAALFAGSANLGAQTVAEQLLLGDQAEAALKPADALRHFEAVIAIDSLHAEALWKASKSVVDLGEFEKDKKKREAFYRKGEQYARRAVTLSPNNADARFHLARALGMAALSVGVKERVRYAKEVREQALESLKLQPEHPGALHVLGVWNAEVMRLSGIERTLAKAFLGGGFFSEASWDDAIRYMEQSAKAEPARITHFLDLARVYRDRKMKEKAREAYQRVIDGKAIYYNDEDYKRVAAAELARVKLEDSQLEPPGSF
jgi:tetratricopeptide (TPR) repeat protein